MLLVLGQSSSAQHEPSGDFLRTIHLQSLNITQGLDWLGFRWTLKKKVSNMEPRPTLSSYFHFEFNVSNTSRPFSASRPLRPMSSHCFQLDPSSTARTFMATSFERPWSSSLRAYSWTRFRHSLYPLMVLSNRGHKGVFHIWRRFSWRGRRRSTSATASRSSCRRCRHGSEEGWSRIFAGSTTNAKIWSDTLLRVLPL